MPNKKSVNINVEPLKRHLAKTYPFIEPIIAEIIDDWTTKKAVRAIGARIVVQIGPHASKFKDVGSLNASAYPTPVMPLTELTTIM
jgi:hypothetical protein